MGRGALGIGRAAIALMAPAFLSCEGPTDPERCAAVEARLSAELLARPTACRQAADCVPIRVHCSALAAAAAPPAEAITTLSKRFEDLDCCGADWDGGIPDVLPDVDCQPAPPGAGADTAGDGGGDTTDGAEDAAELPPRPPPDQCVAPTAASCQAACNLLAVCPDRDPDAWLAHAGGCVAGCTAAQAAHPARTLRLVHCTAHLGCGGEATCAP